MWQQKSFTLHKLAYLAPAGIKIGAGNIESVCDFKWVSLHNFRCDRPLVYLLLIYEFHLGVCKFSNICAQGWWSLALKTWLCFACVNCACTHVPETPSARVLLGSSRCREVKLPLAWRRFTAVPLVNCFGLNRAGHREEFVHTALAASPFEVNFVSESDCNAHANLKATFSKKRFALESCKYVFASKHL